MRNRGFATAICSPPRPVGCPVCVHWRLPPTQRQSRPRTASCRSAPSTRDCDAGLFNRQIADRLMSRCTPWRDISNSNEARALIRTALNGSGDIIPERDTMHTRLDPLSAPRRRHRPTLPNPRQHQPGLPRHHAHPGVTAPNPIAELCQESQTWACQRSFEATSGTGTI